MYSNKDHEFAFYAKQWPALTLPGWKPTIAEGYGLIWWDNPVETNVSNCTARLCLIVNASSTRLVLEVRAQGTFTLCTGMASSDIGTGLTPPESVQKNVADALPGLIDQAQQQLIAQEESYSGDQP